MKKIVRLKNFVNVKKIIQQDSALLSYLKSAFHAHPPFSPLRKCHLVVDGCDATTSSPPLLRHRSIIKIPYRHTSPCARCPLLALATMEMTIGLVLLWEARRQHVMVAWQCCKKRDVDD